MRVELSVKASRRKMKKLEHSESRRETGDENPIPTRIFSDSKEKPLRIKGLRGFFRVGNFPTRRVFRLDGVSCFRDSYPMSRAGENQMDERGTEDDHTGRCKLYGRNH